MEIQREYANETYAIEANRDFFEIGGHKIRKTFDSKLQEQVVFAEMYTKAFANIKGTRSFPLSWLLNRSNFLIDSINKFLMECEQHGFYQKFYNDRFHYVPSLSDENDPQKLTLDILSAGFIVWIVTVAIACIVFIIEHLIAFLTRKRLNK